MLNWSRETLQEWLDEFNAQRDDGALLRVIPQAGFDDVDSGLVVIPLVNATTSVYLEHVGAADWRVTIEPQPSPTVLSSSEMHSLSAELITAAELCDFFEQQSARSLAAEAFLRTS